MDPSTSDSAAGQDATSHSELSWHHSCDAADFRVRFEAAIGKPTRGVIEEVIDANAAHAAFLTGSVPLGMANGASDVDFIVLVDDQSAMRGRSGEINNTSQKLAFYNENNTLRAGLFNTVMNGITVEVSVVIAPGLQRIRARLRSRGPELDETEMMIMSRLATGWHLWESGNFLERSGLVLNDPAFDLYCCTRYFTFALIYGRKAVAALHVNDIPLALHLGRLSVEMAYVAHFASEGFGYLGPKWLAQIGHARSAPARLARVPDLRRGLPLLFPGYTQHRGEAEQYLRNVTEFIGTARTLIEQKVPFRVAFAACAQIRRLN